jgi:ParB family chromosome partitioning protein
MAIAKKPGSARRKRTIPTRDALDVAEPTSGLVAAATPSNLVELDPGLIADAGLKDRHTEDPEIEALAESIRTHGQQVPVIVHFKEGSGYSLIAGRRRRLACLLDQRVVLARVVPVADLDEAHALQIIENKDRRDISFSEHLLTFLALAPEQREALWSRAGFDRQWRSHMRKILETVPAEALRWIGADEKLGRQKLRQLADLAERAGPKKTQDTFSEARKAVPNSTSPAQRLAAYAARLKPEPATRPKCTGAVLKRGARTAELKNGLVVRLTDEVILVESPDPPVSA